MNVKEKIYTDFVGFKTTAELKTKFLHAQSLDKAKFTAILSALCDKFIAAHEVKPHEHNNNDEVKPHESELTTNQEVKPHVNENIQEVKPHVNENIQEVKPHKSKKVKVVEKSMFEQDMAEQAEYDSKHSINRLFEVEQ